MALPTVIQVLLPKKKPTANGASITGTYQPANSANVLTAPTYRNHLTDIFSTRVSNDARALIKDLVKYDSDVSATLHAFLTIADTPLRAYVYDQNGALDREGQKQLDQLFSIMFKRNDYQTGFEFKKSLRETCEDFRYMVLMRGGLAAELIFDKFLLPTQIRQIDLATIEWFEKQPGVYKPQQTATGSDKKISLDSSNLFVNMYRQNPTEIYAESIFVSSINTIASRQQVINDLYRIMQKTGYPRLEITVMEEVLRKNAPASLATDEAGMRQWITARMSEIAQSVTDMRPDSVYVHTDAIKSDILNKQGPGQAFDVTAIIEVLNAQNQAALKTMATIIGRGKSGTNTASVEARVFSKSADSLNGPVADALSAMFTYALRLQGYAGYVECEFSLVELRPDMELEPQRTMLQARLLQDLSLGLITDDEYHITMYNRHRPDAAPELSGTGFYDKKPNVDVENVSPNSDPLGRSITPSNTKQAKSNTVKPAGSKTSP